MELPPATRYKLGRICLECGHAEELEITKREAAFGGVGIHSLLGKTCKQCSATRCTTSRPIPDLDHDLIWEWATNAHLHLLEQDEELLLAEDRYLDLILEVLDTEGILDGKRNLLMAALCVMIYDKLKGKKAKKDREQINSLIEQIKKRQEKLILADAWIMDYIKKVVYPKLQLDWKKKP